MKGRLEAPNCEVLLISGSLRAGSVNAAVLKTTQELVPEGINTRIYDAMANLPHFNPDDDQAPLDPLVAELRSTIGSADALLFCTPEYAGALPGSFKNLLDWTVGGGEMDRKPVAWINAASRAAPTGGEDAHASLRKVMEYVGTRIIEIACVRIPMSRGDVGTDGLIRSDSIRSQIKAAVIGLASEGQGGGG